jgi:hypothetical protein
MQLSRIRVVSRFALRRPPLSEKPKKKLPFFSTKWESKIFKKFPKLEDRKDQNLRRDRDPERSPGFIDFVCWITTIYVDARQVA